MHNKYLEWQQLTIKTGNGLICSWIVTKCEWRYYLLHNEFYASGSTPIDMKWYSNWRQLWWADYDILENFNFIELYLSKF